MTIYSLLARIFFFLVVYGVLGVITNLLWDKWVYPRMLEEDMSNKLDEAGEDYIESQVDKTTDKLRKGGKR